MLDETMKTQLKGYLERVVRPIEIAARADGSENSREMMALLNDIVPLSDKITLTEHRAACATCKCARQHELRAHSSCARDGMDTAAVLS